MQTRSRSNVSARARARSRAMSSDASDAFCKSSSSTPPSDEPTTSSGPATGNAATGVPQAIASSITGPKVSLWLGNTKASAAL